MALSLEDLERRLAALEREVAEIRQLLAAPSSDETSAQRGARLLREAERSHGQFAAGWARAMEAMGIRGEPVGAEKLQQMIAAAGFKPEDNEFSRGILEMREE